MQRLNDSQSAPELWFAGKRLAVGRRQSLDFGTIVVEGLGLPDKLVHQIKQPNVRKSKLVLLLAEKAEKLQIVVPRLDAVVQRGRKTAVNVAIKEFSVQQMRQFSRTQQLGNLLDARPGRVFEETLRQLVERVLVNGVNLLKQRKKKKLRKKVFFFSFLCRSFTATFPSVTYR